MRMGCGGMLVGAGGGIIAAEFLANALLLVLVQTNYFGGRDEAAIWRVTLLQFTCWGAGLASGACLGALAVRAFGPALVGRFLVGLIGGEMAGAMLAFLLVVFSSGSQHRYWFMSWWGWVLPFMFLTLLGAAAGVFWARNAVRPAEAQQMGRESLPS